MYRYEDAGVSLKEARSFVERLKELQTGNRAPWKFLGKFGLFSSAIEVKGYEEPVILATCDGVGTKLLWHLEYGTFEEAGWDCVGMNVNDILPAGGIPVMFLDYLGVASIQEEKLLKIVKGMKDACEEAECLLAGGETAEMPDMVPEEGLELAGFCVGLAEKRDLLPSDDIKPGDWVLGIPSSGFHSNGFSLVRKIVKENRDQFTDDDILSFLKPTRIYTKIVSELKRKGKIKALAHITGGGIPENFARVLPEGLGYDLKLPRWEDPAIQKVLEFVPLEEQWNVFNMGFGMLLVVEDPEPFENEEVKVLGRITENLCRIEVAK